MKMYFKDNIEMMDIYSLEQIGGNLVFKGKLMQSVTATFYLTPEDFVNAMKLMTWRVALYLPIIFVKGLWCILLAKVKKTG